MPHGRHRVAPRPPPAGPPRQGVTGRIELPAAIRAQRGDKHVLARAPTATELAHYLDVDPDDVRQARECAAGHFPVSLSTPIDDGGGELSDLIGDRDESVEAVPERVTVAAQPSRVWTG